MICRITANINTENPRKSILKIHKSIVVQKLRANASDIIKLIIDAFFFTQRMFYGCYFDIYIAKKTLMTEGVTENKHVNLSYDGG